ncbi:MAG: tetratricopeptide repeat protein, partial [Candidatus Pacebacteria bacterium]|nr:tetratricopeptide repeat protein [Candidatus Paceibacterota bacterium]
MIKLEKIAFWIVLAVVFLIPIAFLSPKVLPLDMLKTSIFSIGSALSFLLVLITGISSGKIRYPKGILAYASLSVVLAFILSGVAAMSTGGIYKSFFAVGTETTTVLFALLAIAFVYTITTLANTKERVLALLSSVVLGGVILGLFHISRLLFGVEFLSFGGLFGSQIANTLGQWNDLGVYFGFILLVSYLGLELMSFSKGVRVLLYITGIIAFVLTAIVGFSSVWYSVAFVVLLVGLYTKKHSKISINTIVLFVLVILFAVFNSQISDTISKKLNINQIDVRPSWELSTDIAAQTLSQSPFFGAGPNRFVNEYLRTKPASINQTVFWSVDFFSGVSYLTSFVITLGAVGVIAILFLLFAIGRYSFKVYRHTSSDPINKFVLVTGTVTTIYGIILSILYTPSFSVTVLGCVIFALFTIGLHQEGLISFGHSEGGSPRKLLLVRIIAAVAAVLALISFIFFVRRVMAAYNYQQALVIMSTTGNLDDAEKYVDKAISKVDRELYLQGKTELVSLKISRFLGTVKEVDQKTVDTLKSYLEDGVNTAHALIKLDKVNYQNYIAQARVYESVIPARVEGAYDNAMKSYASAAALNPGNPSVYLSAAQIEVAMGKLPEAKTFIGRALQVKNNYSDAIFLLSQIQVAEKSIKDAITSLLVLAQLNPQDPTIFFQLGLLYYNEGDNINTGLALSKAVELNPEYSNARYFLGLALARLGKYPEAAAQFTEIQKFNPDNTEVAQILAALQA